MGAISKIVNTSVYPSVHSVGSRRGGLAATFIAKLASWWYSLPFTTEIVNNIGDQDLSLIHI